MFHTSKKVPMKGQMITPCSELPGMQPSQHRVCMIAHPQIFLPPPAGPSCSPLTAKADPLCLLFMPTRRAFPSYPCFLLSICILMMAFPSGKPRPRVCGLFNPHGIYFQSLAHLELGAGDDGLLEGPRELLPRVHDILGRPTRHRHPVPVRQLLQEEAPPAPHTLTGCHMLSPATDHGHQRNRRAST